VNSGELKEIAEYLDREVRKIARYHTEMLNMHVKEALMDSLKQHKISVVMVKNPAPMSGLIMRRLSELPGCHDSESFLYPEFTVNDAAGRKVVTIDITGWEQTATLEDAYRRGFADACKALKVRIEEAKEVLDGDKIALEPESYTY
jgi:hypothetical protein